MNSKSTKSLIKKSIKAKVDNSTKLSECQNYSSSATNSQYFTDLRATKILQENKLKVYTSFDEFEMNLINKLNQDSKVRYHYRITDKYVVLGCTGCKKFSYWFKNAEGIEM